MSFLVMGQELKIPSEIFPPMYTKKVFLLCIVFDVVSFLLKSRTHFSLKLFLVKIQFSYDKICSGKARKIFKIDFPSRLKGDPKKLKNPRVI